MGGAATFFFILGANILVWCLGYFWMKRKIARALSLKEVEDNLNELVSAFNRNADINLRCLEEREGSVARLLASANEVSRKLQERQEEMRLGFFAGKDNAEKTSLRDSSPKKIEQQLSANISPTVKSSRGKSSELSAFDNLTSSKTNRKSLALEQQNFSLRDNSTSSKTDEKSVAKKYQEEVNWELGAIRNGVEKKSPLKKSSTKKPIEKQAMKEWKPKTDREKITFFIQQGFNEEKISKKLNTPLSEVRLLVSLEKEKMLQNLERKKKLLKKSLVV